MKKQLIIVGIIVLLITVVLSGCNEQSNDRFIIPPKPELTDYVELSNLKVITEWYDSWSGKLNGTQNGFYHNYPDDYNIRYKVTGTITNIVNKPIDKVDLTVNFYDNLDNLLQSESVNIYTLYVGESKDFTSFIYEYTEYFEYISDYKVVITNVDFH